MRSFSESIYIHLAYSGSDAEKCHLLCSWSDLFAHCYKKSTLIVALVTHDNSTCFLAFVYVFFEHFSSSYKRIFFPTHEKTYPTDNKEITSGKNSQIITNLVMLSLQTEYAKIFNLSIKK